MAKANRPHVATIPMPIPVKPRVKSLPVPSRWRSQLQSILIPADSLARRIRQLGRQIQRDYRNRDLVVVALLNGTVIFLADLLRQIELPLRLDFIGVSTYRGGTVSQELIFTKQLRLDVRGRDVLIIDDILDTGKTLGWVLKEVHGLKPRSVKLCVLLDKKVSRNTSFQPDYTGFHIPDLFVVGYGLDFDEQFRNLPFIGVLHPDRYHPPVEKDPKKKQRKVAKS